MGWCLLAILLRIPWHPKIWPIFYRFLPPGYVGLMIAVCYLAVYNPVMERERRWWSAGPRRRRLLAEKNCWSDDEHPDSSSE